jgi:hypothetical protein
VGASLAPQGPLEEKMIESADQQSQSSPSEPSRVGITLETFILEGQIGNPAATGAFTSLLNQIALAAKLVTSKVRRAGLATVTWLHRTNQHPR